MSGWLQGLIGLLSLAATVVVAWITGRYSARAAEKTAEAQAEVASDANAITGYHQLVGDLRADLDRLRADHEDLVGEHRELKTHVEKLERQAIRDKRLIRYLIEYARRLQKELQRHGIPIPEVPGGIDLDDPEALHSG